MKPNADMITKILHNLRVNGRFNQDQLIIGRGQDEQLQLTISDTVGIRYTPGVAGERTFQTQMMSADDHPVYGTPVTLYPYPKPVNDYTNRTVLSESTMVWVSDPLPDFPTTVFAMMVTTDNTENVAPAMAKRWSLRSLNYNENDQDVDWNNSSETILVCGNAEITWSGDEASMYPVSPSDWATTGSLSAVPLSFSMAATEGSDPKLEYTNDGTTWYEFGGQGSVSLTYEPIEFNASHLSSDGKITIQHNFNDKNVLCLGYTPQPKEIEYLDNEIVLDYSDQNSSNLSGAVWFVNSKQEMLVVPVAPEPRNVPENLTSNTSDKNWSIMKTSVNPSNPNEGLESDDPEMFQMFDNDVSTGCTFSGSAGSLYRWNRSDLTPIKPEKLYVKQGDFLDLGAIADGMMLFVYASNTKVTSPYETGSLTEIANHMGGAAGTYEIDLSSNSQSYIYWYVMMVNAETGTIYEIAEDPIGGG